VIICASSWRPIDSRSAVCAHGDGLDEVLDFENGFLGVPDQPEDDGVDVDRNRVAGEGRFRRDAGHAHALVHIGAQGFDDGHNVEDARAAESDVVAQAQNGDLLPLLHYLDGEHEIDAQHRTRNDPSRMFRGSGDDRARQQADDKQRSSDAADLTDFDFRHGYYLLCVE